MNVNGFKSAAFAGGLRYKTRLDLGLIVADEPAVVAGVFTRNLVAAAPVLWCQEKIQKGRARAILVNAGQANACTGEEGRKAAEASAKMVALALGCQADEVLLASTGVIGQPLNLARLEPAVPQLAAGLAQDNLTQVANAIMTTDLKPKVSERTGVIDGKTFTIAGMAKGSGMIMPNMATMLAFVLTDAAVAQPYLQTLLVDATERSFNRITVDGDTSTNDTLIALASGKAGNPVIASNTSTGAAVFKKALFEVLYDLARMIAEDGEGATKLVKIAVSGGRDEAEAKMAAMTVANSPLVKTALFGQDANWGRIMGALGRSGALFDPDKVDISVDDAPLVKNGMAAGDEAAASAVMRGKEFAIRIDLKAGTGQAEVLTCDLSFDYIKINADYRS